MAAAEALGGNGTTSAVMRTLFLPPAYQDSAESSCLILRDGFTAFCPFVGIFRPRRAAGVLQSALLGVEKAALLFDRRPRRAAPRAAVRFFQSPLASDADREQHRQRRAPNHRDRLLCRARQNHRRGRLTAAPSAVRSVADACTPVETTIFKGASHDRDH